MSIVPCCSGSMLTLPVSDHTSPPELTAAVAAGSGVRLYVILLGAQCAGDLGILLHGIPIYRRFLTAVVDQRADLSTFAWAAASVVVIQVDLEGVPDTLDPTTSHFRARCLASGTLEFRFCDRLVRDDFLRQVCGDRVFLMARTDALGCAPFDVLLHA